MTVTHVKVQNAVLFTYTLAKPDEDLVNLFPLVLLSMYTDVDECVENANVTCNQTCINIDGSYYCSCTQGYRLASDGYSCDGE